MSEDSIDLDQVVEAFADELHDEALDRDDVAGCSGVYTGFCTRRPVQ